ncbi:MAG: cytochrome c oxidase subunit I, partial [Proteobacteria bacterium]|nr:cytochrome c oxidase subunit I [Pseudomonadota bacterium]
MNSPETVANLREGMARAWRTPTGWRSVSAVNQSPVGRRYLLTGFVFFLLGGIMALLMRTQLAVPQNDIVGHQLYNELFTMHGTTMLFLFAVPILEGAAVYLVPPMIGTRDMAFPRLGAFGYWWSLFGGILRYSSFFFSMVPDAGWTMYTPLSNAEFSAGRKIDFWLVGITLVEIGTIVAAAEIAVTVLKCRAPGMSLNRMPLFAWYMLVVSFMILFGFPPLILGDLLLEIQRSFNWPFFDPARGGDPLLWQHLFWIFGHPEVYIIFLPAAGFVSMMIATFSRHPTVGYPWLVVAAVGTGFVSFGLWVHHMFTTGIPLVSMSFFSAASMTVAIFAGIQIFAWIATLWKGKPVLHTPMLFVAGFIFTFVAGGLTGVMLAVIPFDWQAHSTYFLIAHFHYVLIGGMVFPLFGAFYYWYPLVFGRMLSEKLGKWNFWILFIGFNVAFFPMHIAGMKGMPRRVYTYPDGMWEWENLVSTIGSYMVAVAVLLFIFNFVYSRKRGEIADSNPWQAGTLEWATPLPKPAYNFQSIPEIGNRYPLWSDPDLPERIVQGEFLLPEATENQRLMLATSAVKGDLEFVVVQPKPDFAPLLAAGALTVGFVGFLVQMYWLAGIGLAAFMLALLWWLWRMPHGDEELPRKLETQLPHSVAADAPRAFGWWGHITGLASDASIFASLVFAYCYLWSLAPGWP